MCVFLYSTVMQINTDGSNKQAVGPVAFGRLNDIHLHKNGFGFSGMLRGRKTEKYKDVA